jgi:ABC-type uncharacterized transport system permease subunit
MKTKPFFLLSLFLMALTSEICFGQSQLSFETINASSLNNNKLELTLFKKLLFICPLIMPAQIKDTLLFFIYQDLPAQLTNFYSASTVGLNCKRR